MKGMVEAIDMEAHRLGETAAGALTTLYPKNENSGLRGLERENAEA